jgi:hypothetical protein
MVAEEYEVIELYMQLAESIYIIYQQRFSKMLQMKKGNA